MTIKFTAQFKATIKVPLTDEEKFSEYICGVELYEKYKDPHELAAVVAAKAWNKAVEHYFSTFYPQCIMSIEMKNIRRD